MARIIFTMLFFALSATVGTAQGVAGENEPEFVQAKQAWLHGDDPEALQSLSDLANDDNIAAQILLSRIADTPWHSAHISENLTRADRIALFREAKGLSGKDWLARASQQDELAKALWSIRRASTEKPDFNTIIPLLISYGDISTAYDYLHQMLAFHGDYDGGSILLKNRALFGAAGHNLLGTYLVNMAQARRPLPLPIEINTQEKFGEYIDWLRSPAHQIAGRGYQIMYGQNSNIIRIPKDHNVSEIVMQLPDLEPIVEFCRVECSVEEQDICRFHGLAAVSLNDAFPYPFASPAQSLIPDKTYWSSKRMTMDVSRMMTRGNFQGCRLQ